MSSTLTPKILNPHANLYLQLCLLFGPLGLKNVYLGPKVRQILTLFFSAIYLTHCFYLLPVESNEYVISPSDMEPKQIVLGPMAWIKAVLVAGDTGRAGQMPCGPGSLAGINGHSTSLQQRGSHGLSELGTWL